MGQSGPKQISLVVEKRTLNRLIYIYINGIMSGAAQYPSEDNFQQKVPQDIMIGSEGCTIDLYNIRVYDNDLNQYQMLDNFIGDLDDYDKALASDPNNVDALLALAAIAQREGHIGDADRYLQRAIEADPRSPAALAAALGSNAGGDQQASESRLKSLLSTQPESGPLNFALGNLYARQGRWSEAQQAYFNAVAADADNPDYLFNLAVSLDQLRQPKLAAQHYRLALEAAQRHPAAFDRERVKLRLSELQP